MVGPSCPLLTEFSMKSMRPQDRGFPSADNLPPMSARRGWSARCPEQHGHGQKSLLPMLAATVACALFLGCALQEGDAGAEPTKSASARPTNRLAKESSPYLLLHAHNPVDWYPWGPEALERAKRDDKPIFISIGYSTCYWCHVMERKVFSDPKIAAYMNEHFINIKIDREERPDLDELYLTALQVYFQAVGSNQSGGWPMSLFLTPDGRPLGGGTYFPPEDDGDAIGFSTLLERVNA